MQPPALAPTFGRVLQDPIGYLITDVVLRNASPMSFDVMLLDAPPLPGPIVRAGEPSSRSLSMHGLPRRPPSEGAW
jgi:hypothetical protein